MILLHIELLYIPSYVEIMKVLDVIFMNINTQSNHLNPCIIYSRFFSLVLSLFTTRITIPILGRFFYTKNIYHF